MIVILWFIQAINYPEIITTSAAFVRLGTVAFKNYINITPAARGRVKG